MNEISVKQYVQFSYNHFSGSCNGVLKMSKKIHVLEFLSSHKCWTYIHSTEIFLSLLIKSLNSKVLVTIINYARI